MLLSSGNLEQLLDSVKSKLTERMELEEAWDVSNICNLEI
jgi:hypothetical protein